MYSSLFQVILVEFGTGPFAAGGNPDAAVDSSHITLFLLIV